MLLIKIITGTKLKGTETKAKSQKKKISNTEKISRETKTQRMSDSRNKSIQLYASAYDEESNHEPKTITTGSRINVLSFSLKRHTDHQNRT